MREKKFLQDFKKVILPVFPHDVKIQSGVARVLKSAGKKFFILFLKNHLPYYLNEISILTEKRIYCKNSCQSFKKYNYFFRNGASIPEGQVRHPPKVTSCL